MKPRRLRFIDTHLLIGFCVALFAVVSATGCADQESLFTQGRIETSCDGAVPICNTRAGCVLGNDVFLEGSFPGGRKMIVPTETPNNQLFVRFLFRDMRAPGTEMLVRANDPDCSDFDETHLTDVDLIERAGDDQILEFKLKLDGRGDHLLKVFSDMTTSYKMTTKVERPKSGPGD